MDTSPEYILQCERAGEIQQMRAYDKAFSDGDWWISRKYPDAVACAWRAYKGIDDVWLPRQDQLQEMVRGFLLRSELVFSDDALSEAGGQRKLQYNNPKGLTTIWGDSYEQLWFALVMKECYNKIWSTGKEEWVKWAKF